MDLQRGARVTMRDVEDDAREWPATCIDRAWCIPDDEAGTVVAASRGVATVVWDGLADEAEEDPDGVPYLPAWQLPVWALELVADGPDLALALLDDAIRVEIDGYSCPTPPDGCSTMDAFRHLMGHVDAALAEVPNV